LPRNPEPPLNYQIVYSIEGMLDYYTTRSWMLRGGKRAQIDALTEVEEVRFENPALTLEAFHTAGGLSTMADRYEGRIGVMEYKTLRYPGHAEVMRAIRDLGLLDQTPVEVGGARVTPRDVFIATAGPRLRKPAGRDIVVLRVEVRGSNGGSDAFVRYDLLDSYDEKHDISAMMRTTGYSLAVTALMQARGSISRTGVHTPDECVPADEYIRELDDRGIVVRITRG
jgi:lysine 6-dehydrogenase